MNRLDRLTAILTQLQSKRLIRANEIAERFGVSLRTVYRDMRALEEAGVPIIGEAGQGYALVDGYRLPPVMFTREEALSFLVAEKVIEKVADRESSKNFQAAVYKIKSVFRQPEKDVIEHLSSHIQVRRKNSLQAAGKEQVLQGVLDSLSENKLIEICYTSFVEEQTTTRILEPIGVYFAFEQWYMIAYCRLRKDYRTFRLDRINGLKVMGEKFEGEHPSLQTYLEKIEKEENLTKVVIATKKSMVKYLHSQLYDQGFVLKEDCGETVLLTFMTCSIEGFMRWIIMMADEVTIIQPQELKDRLKELLETMLRRHSDLVAEFPKSVPNIK
ncbi:helix-turn-helix transcriptional regulator [Cyclobacterium plantarum]|uniref:helix-turn-helix transcriptional regulator n=1 Tax=Cyclobacterium plantarum TaxID=2716263 RepID=UPI003F701072